MSSGSLCRTRAAVSRWMSAPRANASLRCSSPETWARIRSSICGVVGGEQDAVRIAGHERAPDPPPERGADRDVLEVRVRRGQPAGRCDGLVERRVEAAVGRQEHRQRLDIRRPQLRVDAPFEELVDHRVRRSKVLEHRGVGREARLRSPALRQVELEEEDLLELLRAAEIELVADVVVDLRLRDGRSRP